MNCVSGEPATACNQELPNTICVFICILTKFKNDFGCGFVVFVVGQVNTRLLLHIICEVRGNGNFY